jgi:hypothetical protein
VEVPHELAVTLTAADFYMGISLPSVVELASSGGPPRMALTVGFPTGGAASAEFAMQRAGSGFRFASPSTVDYWLATSAAGASMMKLQMNNLTGRAVATGVGEYGAVHYLRDFAVAGQKGLVEVSNVSGQNQYNQN